MQECEDGTLRALGLVQAELTWAAALMLGRPERADEWARIETARRLVREVMVDVARAEGRGQGRAS